MKITSIDVYDFGKCLNYEDCSPICIRINTDAGISGFGEVGLAYGNAHNAGVWMVKDFGQLIIGMDPLRSEAIREKLFRTTFWGMGGGTVINACLLYTSAKLPLYYRVRLHDLRYPPGNRQ